MMRSSEKQRAESSLVETCLKDLIADFKSNGAWERLQCVELIFVLGWANKDVATRLHITEQAVANHKFFVVSKLKDAAKAETNHGVGWFNLSLSQSSVLVRKPLFYHPFSRQIAKFNALAKLTQTR